MTLPSRFLPLALVLVLLMAAASASAWHQDEERENAMYGALGGDPRVLEDMGPCREETRNESGVSCAVLYGHIHDILNPVGLNTQIPADCAPDLARGSPGPANIEPVSTLSRMELFVLGSFMEYPTDQDHPCDDRPRTHWERGLGDELQVSDAAPIRAYWYLSADALESTPLGIGTGTEGPTPSTGVLPCLTVRVVLETGRYIGKGEILAEGTTTKTVLSTPYGQGTIDTPLEDPCPDSQGTITGEEVTEFQVELPPVSRSFATGEDFTVGVHWYQHDGTSGDPAEEDNVVQSDWNLRTGSELRNRIVLPVEQPIRVLDLEVREAKADAPGDRVTVVENLMHPHRIHLVLRTPWGGYDVDEENIRFHAVHEDGTRTRLQHIGPPREAGFHDFHPPRNLSFSFDPHAEDLGPGTYTLQVSAPNWQHTAQAQAETLFVIEEDEEIQTALLPGPGIVQVLLLLGLLVGLAKGPRSCPGSFR